MAKALWLQACSSREVWGHAPPGKLIFVTSRQSKYTHVPLILGKEVLIVATSPHWEVAAYAHKLTSVSNIWKVSVGTLPQQMFCLEIASTYVYWQARF